MKNFIPSLVRALVAAIVGVFIIQYREDTVRWITIASGILFFVSGVISCAIYYSNKRMADEQQAYGTDGKLVSAGLSPAFPLVGIGSIILGIILALMPVSFISGVMFALAAILILGAINQYVNLGRASRYCRIGLFYWLLPTIVFLVAIFLIVKPIEVASTPLLITGWCLLLYAASEVINGFKWMVANRRRKDMDEQNVEEVPVIEEITPSEPQDQEP
ncbi:MAG: DUF308 domain-containing protein [Prevotella sp.]|nr:DUF308 domain-containing protein [Prevotella sp.]